MKHQCVITSHMTPTGDLALNPAMCPDWESNRRPFGLQPTLNPLSYTSQVGLFFFKLHFTDYYSCPNFPPFTPIHQAPPPLQAIPTSLFMFKGVSSLTTPFPTLYFTSPGSSVSTYLYFLVPSPLHPFLHIPSHLGMKTCSVSMILSLFLSLFRFFFRFNCW